jgi:hypothetical protein
MLLPHDSSLISELLKIYNGKYIVKISVINRERTLTAIASGETVEAAEDKARIRVLGLLQEPTQSTEQIQPKETKQKRQSLSGAVFAEEIKESEGLPLPKPNLKTLPTVKIEEKAELEELLLTPPSTPTPEEIEAPPHDFNTIMATIDVEMKRLSWTKEQGRDYLRTTYGKTSRVQLTDEEILSFLDYLKSVKTAS